MLRLFSLLFCLICLSLPVQAADETYGDVTVDEVVSIYDGDTFRVTIKDWPPVIGHRIAVRLYGVDTPELRDKDPRVKALAREAKQFVVAQLREANKVELRNLRRDKYFRLLAEVYIDGQSLAQRLLDAKLARPYDGGTKSDW